MEYQSLYGDSEVLMVNKVVTEDDTSLSTVELDSNKIELLNASSISLSQIDDAATSDILQNGILVETNKGYVKKKYIY